MRDLARLTRVELAARETASRTYIGQTTMAWHGVAPRAIYQDASESDVHLPYRDLQWLIDELRERMKREERMQAREPFDRS